MSMAGNRSRVAELERMRSKWHTKWLEEGAG